MYYPTWQSDEYYVLRYDKVNLFLKFKRLGMGINFHQTLKKIFFIIFFFQKIDIKKKFFLLLYGTIRGILLFICILLLQL